MPLPSPASLGDHGSVSGTPAQLAFLRVFCGRNPIAGPQWPRSLPVIIFALPPCCGRVMLGRVPPMTGLPCGLSSGEGNGHRLHKFCPSQAELLGTRVSKCLCDRTFLSPGRYLGADLSDRGATQQRVLNCSPEGFSLDVPSSSVRSASSVSSDARGLVSLVACSRLDRCVSPCASVWCFHSHK